MDRNACRRSAARRHLRRLLLQALDVAFRLCSSSAAITPQLRSLEPQDAYLAPSSQQQQQQQQQYAMKSGADAASDVLTRLSEVFIQLLSTPGGLSPEGAVKALRTLAMLRFNPAGDYAGLQVGGVVGRGGTGWDGAG